MLKNCESHGHRVVTNGRRTNIIGDGEGALSPLDAKLSSFNPPSWNISETQTPQLWNWFQFVSENISYKVFTPIIQLLTSVLYTCLVAMLLLLAYDDNCFINILNFLQF